MLCLAVLFIEFTRHISPEVSDERARVPETSAAAAAYRRQDAWRLQDRFVQQRLVLPAAPRRKAILSPANHGFLLPRKWRVKSSILYTRFRPVCLDLDGIEVGQALLPVSGNVEELAVATASIRYVLWRAFTYGQPRVAVLLAIRLPIFFQRRSRSPGN